MPPLPVIVCATGIDCASAKRVSALQASDRWMPPPVSSSGRFALAISFAARSISARSGRMRRAGAFSVASSTTKSSGAKSWVPWATSSGTSSSTGPGRPEVATANARRTSSGMRAVISTRISSLTAGRRISTWRDSWVMFFQECMRLVSPVIATIGMPPFSDSTSPVTRLVAPGPSVPSQMPGRLVTRA